MKLIRTFSRIMNNNKTFDYSETTGASRLEVQLMSKFSDHSCTVWRVSWNLTGTILSSSGDDGCVRMWKSMFQLKENS